MEDLDQNPSDSSTQNNIPPKSEEENTENQTVSESPSPQENETPSTEEITGNKAPDVSTSVDPKMMRILLKD
ncbi:MAG: hypothetical protein HWD61_14470 [Parachlamydiaceae bacterium]|nr:MAG: hypothetical protein HWD61_14470 [Parachlamydiaceae bacterium]